eukprot:SAG31_NODE_25902_length_452_cov_0.436261_1_plen_132_part_10
MGQALKHVILRMIRCGTYLDASRPKIWQCWPYSRSGFTRTILRIACQCMFMTPLGPISSLYLQLALVNEAIIANASLSCWLNSQDEALGRACGRNAISEVMAVTDKLPASLKRAKNVAVSTTLLNNTNPGP